MNNEYIIVNKTLLEKRIEELENVIEEKKIGVENERWLKHELKQILSQSTPLIPEIEKSYDAGSHNHHSQYTTEEKWSLFWILFIGIGGFLLLWLTA